MYDNALRNGHEVVKDRNGDTLEVGDWFRSLDLHQFIAQLTDYPRPFMGSTVGVHRHNVYIAGTFYFQANLCVKLTPEEVILAKLGAFDAIPIP